MAASTSITQGYQCQFIDSVPEDFHCKQCGLVARKLTITGCCGESYCSACIQAVQQDNKPCPGCGEENFETLQQVKYQRKISTLQVHCSLKEKGCGWCGPLEHLDAHLHPDTGDCEYTEVDCPLKCGKKISKKTLDHHTAKECVQRDYVCPYCAFKAIYEIVTDIHWPECTYLPLACPNRCGVTCERPTMEDHLKICPLQEVECQFKHVGCEGKFRREEEEEHMREKSQTHLTIMATASIKVKQDFEGKFEEQERRFEEQERRFEEQERRCEEQERRFDEQKGKFEEQERKFEKQERRFEEQERRFEEKFLIQRRKFEEDLLKQKEEVKETLETVARVGPKYYKFSLKNFSTVRSAGRVWKSPAMYTHIGGHKFSIGINTSVYDTQLQLGGGSRRGGKYKAVQPNGVKLTLNVLQGDYDDVLQQPVKITVTLELINQIRDGENKRVTLTGQASCAAPFFGLLFHTPPKDPVYIPDSELQPNPAKSTHFLKDDTLHFQVTNIELRI